MIFWVGLILVYLFNRRQPAPAMAPVRLPTVTAVVRPTITLPAPTGIPTVPPTPQPTVGPKAFVTFYGYSDNDPSGKAIAYPKKWYPNSRHDEAGGVGAYTDPVTMAVAQNLLPIGSVIYLPYIRKYAVVEDLCASCQSEGLHLDIWMESNGQFADQLDRCQGQWTRRATEVEFNPPTGRLVDVTPLFSPETGECRGN